MNKEKKLNNTTEEKIIEIATNLFAQKGFDGTSTRDICKEAGVNISLISYYFGGKEALYQKVVDSITDKILNYMRPPMGAFVTDVALKLMGKEQKKELMFKILDKLITFFYSNKISDGELMILFREQITSGVPINSEGYKLFKKLLSSILGKDENDKEVIFRALTIVGQIHSARIIKQFSLNLMGQEKYTEDNIAQFKKIIIEQTRFILKGLEEGQNV